VGCDCIYAIVYSYIIYFLKTIGFLPISAEKFAGLIDKNQKK